MRSICKKGSATLAAVLALCALTAASASAAQWYVGGKALTGSEKLAETTKVEENITFTIEISQQPKLDSKLTCSTLKTPKSEITAPATLKTQMSLGGCKFSEPGHPECGLASGEGILTNALVAKLAAGKSPEDTTELAGENSSKTWFSFEPKEACIFFGGEDGSIKGTATLKTPKGQTEATEQELVGEGEASSGLSIYSYPVYFTGKVKLKLASGKAWSFH
jgi:hypothetical protein